MSCLSPRSKGWNMLEAEILIMPVILSALFGAPKKASPKAEAM